jgi:hypothetical protein
MAAHPGKHAGSTNLRTALVLTVIGALLILVSAYLSREELKRYLFPPPPPPPPRQTEPVKIDAADQLVSRLISSLALTDDHISRKQFARNDGEVQWEESFIVLTLPPEISLHQVEHAQARTCASPALKDLRADVVYESDSRLHITILVGRRITHQLYFYLPPPPAMPEQPKPPEAPYRVALVIDDVGENYRLFKELEALEAPITYAILPFQTYSVKIAEEIHAKDCGEIILHLPLEPWNSGNHSMNHGTLLTSMDREELLEHLERNISAVPHLAGVSNHMGSKFTEDGDKMEILLEALREKELYFLDSRTSKKTVGYARAKKMQLKTARRDLFLDSTHDQRFVEMQLQKILPLVQRRGGKLIVIGHPHQNTISTLKEYLPLLKEQGVAIVPLSELVQ